jgi:uncharacterized membrane protein (UPF0127 family)
MASGFLILTGALALGFATGCGPQSGVPNAGTRAAAVSVADEPVRPNPRLPTMQLWVGTNVLTAEIARTPGQIQTGMMFRPAIGENEGMLFVFAQPRAVAFWMKNVTVPLSCAYMDPEGRILEIHDLEPGDENSVHSATGRIQYVLEASRGWFERHRVKTGMQLRTEAGSLAETFFRKSPP